MLASSAVEKPLPKSVTFATSGLGGVLGWILIHPANTIAIRMNLASMRGQTYSISSLMKQPNWFLGLYDGLYAGVWRQLFYATTRFGLFETARDKLHEYRGKTDFAARVGIGAITGGIAAYVSCPCEVAVVRLSNDSQLAVEDRRNYKGMVDTMTRISKEEGIAAFWRGSNPFVFRAMMVGVFQVATLDQFKDLYDQHFGLKYNSIPNVFSAAMTSGLIYSVVTMPLEASKNRMASQKKDTKTGKLPYRGIIQTLTKVSTDEGFLALYKGFFPYYLRCGGHTVSMFVLVELIRNAYKEKMI
eukprot:CAMPEP_0198144640 /NCGR_PEP_ID=MMETSP1443-20131203/17226_1 /TAXON_ID=186043 /ORGANISM="Entomoneis sp., Strain CCMP2396" /LENGTH=300 /DNA_ID=CAMNT_0043808069 /DNA_START=260 /DNA_END=1162 /DNA_ORIENTATION=-